jgi:signal transduction histidine kinase
MFLLPLIVNGQRLFIRQYLADEYKGGASYKITQDKNGVLYVANTDGLLTFDGSEWRLLKLPNHLPVYTVAVDSMNNIYVAGKGLLGYFQQRDGEYIYHSLMHLVPEKFRGGLDIFQIVLVGNDILFYDVNHLFVYSNAAIKIVDMGTLHPVGEELLSINGQAYFFSEGKLYVYKNKDFVVADIQIENGVVVKYIDSYIPGQYIILDQHDNLWILNSTERKGKKMRLVSDKISAYLHGAYTLEIKYLSNGLIAILAEGNLIFFRPDGKKVYHVEPHVLQYVYLSTIFEDDKHNIWLTGNREILQVISSSPLSYYDTENGIHHKILSLCEDDKYLYVGTGWGLYVNEKGSSRFKVISGADGVAWNIYRHQDKVYMAHRNGIWELNGEEKKHVVKQFGSISMCSLKGRKDQFILGTLNGIWLLEQKKTGWTKKRIAGFETETCYIQEDDDGWIWISHNNHGIYRLRLNEAKDSVLESHFYNHHNGLPSDVNNRLYWLKSLNQIIVTTINGIYTFNIKTQRFEPYRPINTALGPDICIYNVIDNAAGDLYFWGAKSREKEFGGLLKRRKDGSYTLITEPFNKIAIPINDLRADVDAPLLVSGNGSVLFGNDLRLVFYNPDQKTFLNDPMPAMLKHVWANDTLIYNAGHKSTIRELPYALNNLRFEVGSILFEDPEKLKYQYKLVGFDNHWSDWGSSGEAVYTNLPDGYYTFSMRVKDQYERMSAPVLFSFTIRPPWYKTLWALTMFISFMIWGVHFIVKIYTWRDKKQKRLLQLRVSEQNQELMCQNEELSAMNEQLGIINEHINEKNIEISDQAKELEKLNATKDKLFSIISHDLRGPVRQVEDILNLVSMNYISENEFRTIIPRLKGNVRQTMNLTENLLMWARNQMEGIQVKPAVFDIWMIVDENVELLTSMASGKNINVINTVIKDQPVYADSDMIRLVLRNLLSNAIKFTPQGGTITIAGNSSEKYIEILIEDTGIGLSDDEIVMLFNEMQFSKYGTSGERGAGIGFSLCREFVEKNGGKVTVTSKLNVGSIFRFTIPKNV